jgi:tetratricopeptide (TPR) repeat protein
MILPGHARTSIGLKYQGALQQLSAGNYNDSLRLLEEIDSLNPFIPEVKNNIGFAYERLGKRDLAVKYYQQALAIKADFAPALNNLGFLSGMTGDDLEKAISMVEKAVSVNGLESAYRDSLGNLFLKAGKLPNARLNFEKGLLLDPDSESIRKSLVKILFREGNYQKCLDTLEKLPEDFSTELIRYRCLKSLTRYTEALDILRKLNNILAGGGAPIADLEDFREEMKTMVLLSVAAGLNAVENLDGRETGSQVPDVTETGRALLKIAEGDIFKAESGDMASARYGLNVMLFEKAAKAATAIQDGRDRNDRIQLFVDEAVAASEKVAQRIQTESERNARHVPGQKTTLNSLPLNE